VDADVAHQGAGVDLGGGYHAPLAQVLGQGLAGAPVGDHGREAAHHEAGCPDLVTFVVLGRAADVADVGLGHGDDLAVVGGIGQDFLVAGHTRVEHDFAGDGAARAEAGSGPDGAVLQRQQCRG
jgi:hypothetical protein